MIEYEFFPARCAICPYKTNADDQLESLEVRKAGTVYLGEIFIGEDGDSPEIENRIKTAGIDVNMANARQGVARLIQKEEDHIYAVKQEVVGFTQDCPGTLVERTKDKHGDVYLFRKCQSPQVESSPVDCDREIMFTHRRGEYYGAYSAYQNRPRS